MRSKSYILIFLIINTFLSAQPYIVEKIDITGLKRTKEVTIHSIIGIREGMEIDDTTLIDIKQRLLKVGIFQDNIDVSYSTRENNHIVLEIYVEDKWTIIPLPVFYTGSEGWTAGGVFIESNLMGLNQKLIGGVFFGDTNRTAFMTWITPLLEDSGYSVGFSLSYLEELDENADIGTNLIVRKTYDNNFGWGIRTGLKTNTEETFYTGDLSLTWDNLYYSQFFNRGWSIDTSLSFETPLEDPFFHPHTGLNISRELLLNENLFKISLKSSITSNAESPLSFGGLESQRIIERETSADNYLSGILHFEPVLLNPQWGHITVPIYYEGGLYNRLDETTYWHGPGLGFRVYISKVTIPAMGADITWNLLNGDYTFTVAVGSSF